MFSSENYHFYSRETAVKKQNVLQRQCFVIMSVLVWFYIQEWPHYCV